ncbi:hypothetical protein GOP47_0017927 [Adiantum capillus-veneris]|uniref:Quinolinate synthase, chloroplastic n=1 Tax=Adiantum capillus-veneris TaxID=13818 RepID=A0A9D4UGC2_ADICA|nr:hypothetical protein GOP47_0017927 [Adiantum capillus-veneris]
MFSRWKVHTLTKCNTKTKSPAFASSPSSPSFRSCYFNSTPERVAPSLHTFLPRSFIHRSRETQRRARHRRALLPPSAKASELPMACAPSNLATVRDVPATSFTSRFPPASLAHHVPLTLTFKLPSCRRNATALVTPFCVSLETVPQIPPADLQKSTSAKDKLSSLVSSLKAIADVRDRTAKLLDYGAKLPPFPKSERIAENRVMGCTAQVWVKVELGLDDRVHVAADSDSEVTKGFCGVLVEALNMSQPQEVMALSLDTVAGLGLGSTASRSNTWYNVLVTMQKRTEMEVAKVEGRRTFELFPSLLLSAEDISAQGSFAVAQAKYLEPSQPNVQELAELLKMKQIGVVAHFYMDPEVQGVLVAAKEAWPNIFISDSLVMADRAVKMAEAGCKHIAVLGVDFMSENVRAILDKAGYQEVNVYRMSRDPIGCSLAEAAENAKYLTFLEEASKNFPALHVVYINTSLETKAKSHAVVPTITCTSSNVVPTVLQAFAQVPNLTVWYGPDSYMGANLAELFRQMANMSDEEIAAIHPMHNKQSILSLLPRLHYYHDGACIVHDLFGHEVVSRVRKGYRDAFLTAHFEVPGEMFALAMEAKQRGMGVVGSTQNILDFITSRVQEAVDRDFDDKLQFVLGTEAGMVTAIVGAVRKLLIAGRSAGKRGKVDVEIVFPVSSEAIATVSPSSSSQESSIGKLSIVPGVSSGEGCSINGGCASCPYMKMNSLDALLRVSKLIATPLEHSLNLQQAKRFNTNDISGISVADLGCEPILHMRHFQSKGSLPEALVDQILSGTAKVVR